MKTKWRLKTVPGTGGKVKTGWVNFTYTPPTETETKIQKIKRALDVLRPLRIFLEGMKAGKHNDVIPYQTADVLKEIIAANEERLRELTKQDEDEKAKVKKKK